MHREGEDQRHAEGEQAGHRARPLVCPRLLGLREEREVGPRWRLVLGLGGALFLRLDLVAFGFGRGVLIFEKDVLRHGFYESKRPMCVGIVALKCFFTQRCAKRALRQTMEFAIFALPILETMAKKGNRVQVILECTEHKDSGMPGTSRYVTTKNRKNTPDRMEIKKFNPVLRRYTVHKEIK